MKFIVKRHQHDMYIDATPKHSVTSSDSPGSSRNLYMTKPKAKTISKSIRT